MLNNSEKKLPQIHRCFLKEIREFAAMKPKKIS